jgi:hypothetical protein
MMQLMRSKFAPWILGTFVCLISFVFIFYGVIDPQSMGGGGNAGEVNGEGVSVSEFNRALSQRMEYFRSIMGKIDEEQLEAFGIRESVFQELARSKVMHQEARAQKVGAGSAELRDRILQYEPFKKDGRFDKVLYRQVLRQNGLNPARFEELIAKDAAEQRMRAWITSLAIVSDGDVEAELRRSREKAKIKYVFVDTETLRKKLGDGKAISELNQELDQLEKKILPALNTGRDGVVKGIAQASGAELKTSDWLTGQSETLPGVGSIRGIQKDLWSNRLDPKLGGAAARYPVGSGTLFVVRTAVQSYDSSKVSASDRVAAAQKAMSAKQSEIFGAIVQGWMKTAKVEPNKNIIRPTQRR